MLLRRCCVPLLALALLLLPPRLASLVAQGARTQRTTNQTAASADPLGDYLRRLGLDDLLGAHLEGRFLAAATPADKERIGAGLVALLSERLRSGKLDDLELQRTLDRLEQVLSVVPQLNTAELESVLLQARHQQAYRLAVAWWDQPYDAEKRAAARTALTALEPRFVRFLADREANDTDLQAQLDRTEEERRVDELVALLGQSRAASLRVLFYAAWNDLYAATAAGAETRSAELARCRDRFMNFLSFEPERDAESIDAESMELDVPLRARAALGLALAFDLLDQQASSEPWFAALGDERVTAEVRSERFGERMLFLLVAERADRAIELARPQVDRLRAPAQVADVRWARTLARFGEQRRRAGSADGESLRSLGYEALVRLRQFSLADGVLDEFDSEPPRPTDAWLGWLVGHRALAAAEQSNRTEAYREAAALLVRATELPGVRGDTGSFGRLTLETGWAFFKSEEPVRAAEEFARAVPLLQPSDRNLAVEAAWMRGVALQQAGESDPTRRDQAIEAFQRLAIEFADHPKSAEARYQIARLQRSDGNSGRSIAALEGIAPSDPNYVDARFELISLRFDAWKKGATDEAKATAYAALTDEVRRFATIATGDDPTRRRPKAMLIAAEAAFGSQRDAEGDDWLEQAGALLQGVAESQPSVAQWHYLRLVRAQKRSDEAQVLTEASWLATRAQVPAYRQAGLVHVTRDLETRRSKSDASEQLRISEQAIGPYEELVAQLGDDPATLAANRNARIALQRLAFHLTAAGRADQAAARYERLLAAFPDDATALRGAGAAKHAAGAWDEAAELWARLANGLDSGSEGWYEARWHELDSLRRVRPDDTRKLWKQFRLLHPDIPFAPWRDRFAALGAQIGE